MSIVIYLIWKINQFFCLSSFANYHLLVLKQWSFRRFAIGCWGIDQDIVRSHNQQSRQHNILKYNLYIIVDTTMAILKLILAWCRIYASWNTALISLVTHICVANPSISLIGPGGDPQNSARPRWAKVVIHSIDTVYEPENQDGDYILGVLWSRPRYRLNRYSHCNVKVFSRPSPFKIVIPTMISWYNHIESASGLPATKNHTWICWYHETVRHLKNRKSRP